MAHKAFPRMRNCLSTILLSLGAVQGCGLLEESEIPGASHAIPRAPQGEGPLRAGTGKAPLLAGLAEPVQLSTYGPLPGFATGVREPVYARAVVLDNGRMRLALVSCNLLIVDAALRTAVSLELEKRGIPLDDFLLCATHSHTSIGGYVDHWPSEFYIMGWFRKEIRDQLVDRIVDAVAEASGKLQPARLGAGRAFVSGLSVNRRIGSTVDPEVGIIKLDRADGAPMALVANFAGHPILEPDDGLISPDYPGYLAKRLDERYGFGLVLQGALGDLDARLEGSEHVWITEGLAPEVAGGLSEAVEKAAEAIETTEDIELGCITLEVELPPLNVGLIPDLLFPLDRLAGILLDWPRRAPLQSLRIGDAAIIACSTEASARIGLQIKRRSPSPYPFVVTHANGYAGYAVTQVNYAKSKLDPTSLLCLNGPTHGRLIVEKACDLMELQWGRRLDPAEELLSPAARERFETRTRGLPGPEKERLWKEAVAREEAETLAKEDTTLPQSRRRSSDFADSIPDGIRLHADYLYLEDLRGGQGIQGRRREFTVSLRTRLWWNARLGARIGYLRSDWDVPGGGGSDEGLTDLLVELERPFTVVSDQLSGTALRLVPVAGLSAPTGNPDGQAPIALAASSGVWRPSFGAVLELNWATYRALSLKAIYTTGIGRHAGRQPGDRLETAFGYAERHGMVSLFLDLSSSLSLADSRRGGRQPVDVSETSFDIGLRPGLTFHFIEHADLFVQGRIPLARGGGGGGGGVGILAGLTLSY